MKKIVFSLILTAACLCFSPVLAQDPNAQLPQAKIQTSEFNADTGTYELISPIGNLDKIEDRSPNGFSDFVNLLIRIAIALAGAIAVVIIIISGIQYMGTDSVWEKGESKGRMGMAIGGLVLLLCSYLVLYTINPDLVNIKIGVRTVKEGEWEKVELLQKQLNGGMIKQYQNQNQYIKDVYIPARDKALPNASKGAKALMTAHTTMEGFYPGSTSYQLNNPGNIGNTGTSTKKFNTLEEGIKAQYDHIEKVLTSKVDPYILNKHITRPTAEDYDPSTSSKRTYPGVDIVYNGTIGHYLQLYSVAARPPLGGVPNPNYKTYEQFMISFFKTEGLTLTSKTTMQQIYDMK